MPLINGMKMACEPCIRGHRSTKCTHANERLMVPVKKPGRPLSACPHLHDQLCGCSSITAAIPRKSRCGCGTSESVDQDRHVRPLPSAIPDAPSPSKVAFKVQKSSKPPSRKLSYDINNLERMDPANINIIPFQRPIAPALPNGYTTSIPQIPYMNGIPGSPYLNGTSPSVSHMSSPFQGFGNGVMVHPNGSNGITNGSYMPLPLDTVQESKSCCDKTSTSNGNPTPQKLSHSRRSSQLGSCCTKETPDLSRNGSTSSDHSPEMPILNGVPQTNAYPFPPALPLSQVLYPRYAPQTTIYSYPASYGSYHHPLQPAEWRQSVISNTYAQQPIGPSGDMSFTTSSTGTGLDTLHSCGCGDTCQCIGCAAHPYNNATQDYVRSAWNFSNEAPTPATSDFTSLEGSHAFSAVGTPLIKPRGTHLQGNGDSLSSPVAETPSDTGTSDEVTLPASDYFFVNYPFSSDGCGGDTISCPCGDDCQCIGCTIHRLDGPLLPPEPTTNGHSGSVDVGYDGITILSMPTEPLQDGITSNGREKSCCG